MPAKTLKEQFIAALTKRGEAKVKDNFKHVVFSRKEGGHYYIGRAGALRFGNSSASSIPCSDKFKALLLQSLDEVSQSQYEADNDRLSNYE